METPPSSSSGYLQRIPPSLPPSLRCWRKKSLVMVASPSDLCCSSFLRRCSLAPAAPAPGGVVAGCDRRHPEMFGLGATPSPVPSVPAHRLQLFRLLYLLFITIHCVPAFISKGDCSCGALCTRCAPGLTKLAVCARRTAVQDQGEQRNLFLNPHVLTGENETTSVLPRGAGKLSWSRCSSSDSISRSILSLELHGYDRSGRSRHRFELSA